MKKTSRTPVDGTRESNLAYTFVKVPKPAPGVKTIRGCVLAGIKAIKSGSLDEATSAAVKAGLAKVTDQDVTNQARVHLRRLANEGFVTVTRQPRGEE